MRLRPLHCVKCVCRQRLLPVSLLVLCLLPACEQSPRRLSADATAALEHLHSVTDTDASALALELADWVGRVPESDGTAIRSPASPRPHRITVDAVKAPLESLLHAIAEDASLDLELLTALPGSVTLKIERASIEEVLRQIERQQPLRWNLDDRRLSVGDANPFTDSYRVDYLNIDRTLLSSVGLATQVGTINAAVSGAGVGIANNSETLVENRADHRFWASLAADLDRLLGGRDEPDNVGYSINRDAGLVVVTGSPAAHAAVSRHLDVLNTRVRRQVLIEATVVEVTLSEAFEAGIDWRLLADGTEGFSAGQQWSGAPQPEADSLQGLATPGGLLSLVQSNRAGNMAATLSLLEQFGDVRILSRPRIIALNNQSSILKVVDNRVYFTVNVERQRSDDADEVITETDIHTVPVGLVMNVTPFIGEDDAVMLNVRPTLSRILGFVDDPNPELQMARVSNGVPEIQVREMESMLQVASGDVAIIGGLMQESTEELDDRLPGLGQLPWLGKLFSSKRRHRRQSELLIVLKPTVLTGGSIPASMATANRGHP